MAAKRNMAAAFTALALAWACAVAEAASARPPVPDTVSAPWAALLAGVPPAGPPPTPAPDDAAAWARLREQGEIGMTAIGAAGVKQLAPRVSERVLGGVPVLEVRPQRRKAQKRLAVYVHGGGYTALSAHSSLISAALFADRTGLEVISIDYTVAPIARWPAAIGQVEAVFKALKAEGVAMRDIVLYGDSAGGGLAAASVLKMRDDGLGLPGALVLWSPWTDLAARGDTRATLAAADPTLQAPALAAAALAYAPAGTQRDPLVSPVYGDFTKGYPPTLIQVGTREILLSDAVRLYQAIEAAGGDATLDVYEGMPHVFQIFLIDAPESVQALGKVRRFVERHLGVR